MAPSLAPKNDGYEGMPLNESGLSRAEMRGFLGFGQTLANVPEQQGGAGSGNRTRIASLEGWCFTTKLYPRVEPACHDNRRLVNARL
jgi:hypothetical protein